jgi:hypothetical protein
MEIRALLFVCGRLPQTKKNAFSASLREATWDSFPSWSVRTAIGKGLAADAGFVPPWTNCNIAVIPAQAGIQGFQFRIFSPAD